MSEDRDPAGESPAGLRQEIVRGLLYVHSRLSVNTAETLEALSLVSTLIEMLIAKGVIAPEELEAARQSAMQSLAGRMGEQGLGVVLQTAVEDKYSFEEGVTIDCASRVSLCRAACCRLSFALSRQDVREGIVRWDMEKPYLNARDPDGCCSHLDRGSRVCRVWESRPAPCRAFDCRRDTRIWVDFEKRIPNPDLARPEWPRGPSTATVPPDFDLTAMENLEL